MPYSKMDEIKLKSSIYTIPHNDKSKKNIYLLLHIPPLMFLQLDWSPPVVSSIDWT
jgi:hypothetical protein